MRELQERFKRRRTYWTGVFRRIVYIWYDGGGRRIKYLAGSSDLTDQCNISGTVCRS